MRWRHGLEARLRGNATRIAQVAWLAFAALALSLAIPGIPRYVDLLRTPCSGVNCFDTQLSFAAAQARDVAGENIETYALWQVLVLLTPGALLVTTSAFLIWRKAHHPVSVIAAFVGTALATSTLSRALAHTDPRFWLPAQCIVFVQIAGLIPLFCLFPDGRFQPRWMRWVAAAYVLISLLYVLPGPREWLESQTIGASLWLVFASIAVVVVAASLFYRFRHAATSVQREQMLWVLGGISLAALAVLLGMPLRLMNVLRVPLEVLRFYEVIELTGVLLAIGSFTCLLVALVNYEPLDANVLVNRTLVYAALTGFVIATYGVIVGYLSTVFHSDSVVFSLIATGLVAVLFQPLREKVQRAVNRLMYGERDEPYRVLTQLGRRLEAAVDPLLALALVVETVAHALKLPYVAITLKQDETLQPFATYGALHNDVTRLPLIYAGETIGELVVAQRTSNEPLTPADHRLLNDLARQIGVAAHAALLTADLARARLRIIAAHEETRRRLGSDLHDGVGHQLAALARQAEVATHLLAHDRAAARDVLADITHQLNTVIAQVRGLAHQLHPPELELLGLVGALRERAHTPAGLVVQMDAPDTLPPLPTAIETAAYYIALEALTNVERHSGARSCHLRLALANGDTALHPPLLELDITDDGRGLPSGAAHGLGLLSMQARAAEAGGTCRIASDPPCGTQVSVRLPCPAPLE